ncbi:hypothetical protein SKAU_G00114610 [Synaphobranchus kaupii]|uniref:Uncharacterized protein n=1 Tax=Synaphobranchus kaupii TaxID=118154 RepID=A0A9Q1J1V4_SYNKA|nr:hypothetical protein SKAU_G00114610 [Synaphobranchus kaupii]
MYCVSSGTLQTGLERLHARLKIGQRPGSSQVWVPVVTAADTFYRFPAENRALLREWAGSLHCSMSIKQAPSTEAAPKPTCFCRYEWTLVTSEVIAVAFCCFLLLVLVGSTCWLFTLENSRADSRVQRRSSHAVPAAVPSRS